MTRGSQTIRAAIALLTIRLVLLQIGLGIIAALLFALWLHVPDASVLDVIGSLALALLGLWVAGAGESALVLRMCGHARTNRLLMRGTILLTVAIVLWFGWSALLDQVHAKDNLRAGYWNSQLPHWLRHFLTYNRLVEWLRWTWAVLSIVGAGVVAAIAIAGTAAIRSGAAIARVLRSGTYWMILLVAAIAAPALTSTLMDWTPGHGLRTEMFSLFARLSAVMLINAFAVCLVLAVVAALIRATGLDDGQMTAAGTPDESQPRTAATP